MVVVISDFYEAAGDHRSRPWSRCAFTATKWSCFTCSIRRRFSRKLNEPLLLVDMETQDSMEVSPEYAQQRVPAEDGRAHRSAERRRRSGAGIDYFLLRTDRPLDEALREYLAIRQGRM